MNPACPHSPLSGNAERTRGSLAGSLARAGAAILIVTAVMKMSTWLSGQDLDERNPVFPFLSDKDVLCCAAFVELAIACYVLRTARVGIGRAMWTLAWITSVFLCYRGGLLLLDPKHPCLCSGVGLLFLRPKPLVVQWIMNVLLAYLMGTSYGWLVYRHLLPKLVVPMQGRPRTQHATPVQSDIWKANAQVSTFLVILLISKGAVVFAAEGAGRELAFEAAGSLDCTFLRDDGTVFTKQSLAFEVLVSGNRWRIRNLENGGNYWERTCNGTDIFHVFIDTRTKLPHYAGFVESGTIPSGGYRVSIPWLAYASSGAAHNEVEIPAPWADPRNDPNAHAYEAEIRLPDRPLFTPQIAIFVLSQGRAARAGASPWLPTESLRPHQRRELNRWRPNAPTNFVGGIYQVNETLETNGVRIPTDFQLTAYRPVPARPDAAASNSPVAALYRGTNIAIRLVPPQEILPASADKPIDVRDLRFQDRRLNISSIYYSISNAWLVSTGSQELQANFRHKMETVPRGIFGFLKAEPKLVLIYTLFVVLVVVPAVVAVLRARRKRGGVHRGRST